MPAANDPALLRAPTRALPTSPPSIDACCQRPRAVASANACASDVSAVHRCLLPTTPRCCERQRVRFRRLRRPAFDLWAEPAINETVVESVANVAVTAVVALDPTRCATLRERLLLSPEVR